MIGDGFMIISAQYSGKLVLFELAKTHSGQLPDRVQLNMGTMTDHTLCAVDLALWDLAGRALNVPVYKMLGGYREKVPAYASMLDEPLAGKTIGVPQEFFDESLWGK